MENITNKILSAIKNKKPESKWKFKLKDYSIWAVGILSVLVGSLSTAVVIYMIANNDWGIRDQISVGPLELIFMSMPFYWILAIILLIVTAYYDFRHTSAGYRYKLLTIVMGTILVSIILGAIFYYAGLGYVIDKTFTDNIPMYERFANPRKMMWINPEEGRLAGKVIFIGEENFKIIDFHNNNWVVEPVLDGLREYELIRIIGERVDQGHFRANRILPFDMRGKFPGPGQKF